MKRRRQIVRLVEIYMVGNFKEEDRLLEHLRSINRYNVLVKQYFHYGYDQNGQYNRCIQARLRDEELTFIALRFRIASVKEVEPVDK